MRGEYEQRLQPQGGAVPFAQGGNQPAGKVELTEKIFAVVMGPYTSGGGETAYVRLTCSDGMYSNPADGEVLEAVGDVGGTAILCNALLADAESGNYLTLADAGA